MTGRATRSPADRYRQLRWGGLTPLAAILELAIPLRLRVAAHVLQGRPTLYRSRLPVPFSPQDDGTLIAECVFEIDPPVDLERIQRRLEAIRTGR